MLDGSDAQTVPPSGASSADPGIHPRVSGEGAQVLIVDDESAIRKVMRRALERRGYACVDVGTGKEALAELAQRRFDLAVFDLFLPDTSGLELLRITRANSPDLAVLMVTGCEESAITDTALDLSADACLVKPFHPNTLVSQASVAIAHRSASFASRKRREALETQLEELPHAVAALMTSLTEMRDLETGAHVRRIARFTEILAQRLGQSAADAALLGRAALLHDVGKVAVPDRILLKPGPLDAQEIELVRRHAPIGRQILSEARIPFFSLAATIAGSHHERWDGSGYPDRLAGSATPIEARIVAAADVYDALSQRRVYKEAWDEDRVLDFVAKERAKQFDPDVADALLASADELAAVRRLDPDPARS